MKASRINFLLNAIHVELENQIVKIETKMENWDSEMENAQLRLLHHRSINDNSTFRINAI